MCLSLKHVYAAGAGGELALGDDKELEKITDNKKLSMSQQFLLKQQCT